ncbi:MAG: hypothetical protein M1834_002094 [Cirrosporium novae-zelandiae]|nr:MAG: hypothetical protein M1834_002094 [Cirrosporium novae-zelandiae]
MGQLVSAVRDQARKDNNETEKMANDALNSLMDLAKLQTQLFKTTVRSTGDNFKVNISKTLLEDTVIKCSVTTDAALIAEHVKKTYKAFADGDVANGLGTVLEVGLNVLFGSATTNSAEVTKYFITVGSLGYPYRVDIHLYTYSFTSEALTKITKNVLAISIVVSSVDLTNMNEVDLGSLVQICYEEATEDIQHKILDKLLAIKEKNSSSDRSGGHDGGTSSLRSGVPLFQPGFSLGLEDGHGKFDNTDQLAHEAWKVAMKEEGGLGH